MTVSIGKSESNDGMTPMGSPAAAGGGPCAGPPAGRGARRPPRRAPRGARPRAAGTVARVARFGPHTPHTTRVRPVYDPAHEQGEFS